VTTRLAEQSERSVFLDLDAWQINGQLMTRSEHRVLTLLVRNAGAAVSKHELWHALWGYVPQTDHGRPTSRALDQVVSRLRRKGVPLLNIWGHGWLLPKELIRRP
jgi:DNA-binding response OmpR family regulator